MHRRSAVTMGLLFAALGVLGLSDEAAGQASRMVVLTDGTSMNNFDAVGDANWRIAERTVTAFRGNGFLVTKQPYGDFRIRAEFWVDEDANSGIFIRCDEGARPSGATCYEVNIFENGFLSEFQTAQNNLNIARGTNPTSNNFGNGGLPGQKPYAPAAAARGCGRRAPAGGRGRASRTGLCRRGDFPR